MGTSQSCKRAGCFKRRLTGRACALCPGAAAGAAAAVCPSKAVIMRPGRRPEPAPCPSDPEPAPSDPEPAPCPSDPDPGLWGRIPQSVRVGDVMASAGASAELRLLRSPWLPVSVGGCRFMAKSWFGEAESEAEYHVLLTDMRCMWEERMETLDIQERAQELNRRLRAPVSAFFSHLRQVAEPCLTGSGERRHPEAHMSVTRQEGGAISLKLKSELAGLPFHWEFHCSPAPVTAACVQLLRPLLAMSRLLQRQVEQLEVLLGRKDAEIQEYRENGATLSRERLQTEVFDEQTYRDDFMAKTLPLLLSEQQDSLGFDTDLQRLYAAVVSHHSAPRRKRKPPEESSPEDRDRDQDRDQDRPHLTSALGSSAVSAGVDPSNQKTTPANEKAARPTGEQSVSTTSSTSAVRPSSKPKKKKVGLFR